MPGLIEPNRDRDADVARRSIAERDDLRRNAGWLLVVVVVVTLISISGFIGCNPEPSSDDTAGSTVFVGW